ncbi:hypothetical protein [Enterobacter kobei]|uniref:hypothetical protein n=1 Tax=Enterobacter kobei TaxID=208224 RepID=UPI000ADBEF84|nr:hypothetical protein [Enterobacter kobei]MBW7701316.1 hypothetical protein [Enterobacter kobei]HCM9516278.1 hypothetical protein [Enterobacter kobei]HCM9530477.1 hypothetical protein [Enterobacter kobei]
MNLTIKQIYELASFSGLMCSSPEESQVDEETEICIDNGVIHDDDGKVEYEGLRACCAD